MVKIFSKKDEQGVETAVSVGDSAAGAGKKSIKSIVSQLDINNFLYGVTDSQKSRIDQMEGQDLENKDPVTEVMKLYGGKATASLKAGINLRNPIVAQEVLRRREQLLKTKTPEKVSELDMVRKRLHDEQIRGIIEPIPEQPEERIADKIAREEEEKKAKKQEKKYEEVKKKEDLAVVQKRTSIENKGFGAG